MDAQEFKPENRDLKIRTQALDKAMQLNDPVFFGEHARPSVSKVLRDAQAFELYLKKGMIV